MLIGNHSLVYRGMVADIFRWIDYHDMAPELEKEYILRQLECLKKLTGDYPVSSDYPDDGIADS